MKRLTIVAAAALMIACTPAGQDVVAPELPELTLPMTDAAGNRMEALTAQDGRWCSDDGVWCLARGESTVTFTRGGVETQLVAFSAETGEPAPWPVIIREPNDASVVLGLGWTERQGYSGGGGEVTKVTLYRITEGSALIPEVGTWPQNANITIRACFDEDDQRRRMEACLDEYNFQGQLRLDAANESGPPRLLLSTLATSFPGARSRSSDSNEEPPLQADDIFIARDDTCSYERAMVWDEESFAYDSAPPVCTDYLEP